MKITIVSFAMAAAFGLIACDNTKHNTLTEQEKAEGWELLFDGETLDGWRDYNGTALTGPWEVVNGTIKRTGKVAMPADTSSPTRLMRILSFRGTGKSRKEEIAVYYIMW